MLTIPCFVFKSSTKDLSFPIFEIMIQSSSLNLMVLGETNVSPIVTHVTLGKVNIVAFQHGF
jgi:hypothetical protein